ncbi:hypothetical protein AX17_003809 [Amanita inopinata Kibby_2008]|nr:hypothetical protein AX17_003809 [Amanita inopinata Kibby_2008]
MFRAFIRQRRPFVSAVSTGTGTVAAAAAAAVGLSLDSDPSQKPEKLSIYPSPTSDILLFDTPSPLELQIGRVRRRVTGAVCDARDQVQQVVNRWIGVEHAVEGRVKSILSPNEQITQGLLYTGISTLTASIIARNRSLPTRLLLPPLFLLLSAHHFLPGTSSNLSSYLGSVEDAYFPRVAEKHDVARAHTRMTWERLREGTKEGREWVGRGMIGVVEKVQEVTGLKVGEVLGRVTVKVEEEVVEMNVQEVEDELDKKLLPSDCHVQFVQTKTARHLYFVGHLTLGPSVIHPLTWQHLPYLHTATTPPLLHPPKPSPSSAPPSPPPTHPTHPPPLPSPSTSKSSNPHPPPTNSKPSSPTSSTPPPPPPRRAPPPPPSSPPTPPPRLSPNVRKT